VSDYTIMRASEAPDYTGDAPGAFLGYARPMGSEQLGVNVRVLEPGMAHVPPGTDPSWGHSHRTIEEVYFVLEGDVTVKLGDDVVILGPRDAVLIPAGTPRAARNDADSPAAFLMISRKAEDIRAESVPHEDFWPG
jgi:mannose-6-phosphate isomerase-like protein (cupin superfamily)